MRMHPDETAYPIVSGRARKIHCPRPKGVLAPPFHMAREVRSTPEHLRRRPIQPFALVPDTRYAGPSEPWSANADALPERFGGQGATK
jgi:hypothetical protein